jgi:hypothetical protein
LTSPRSRTRTVRLYLLSCSFTLVASVFPRSAAAEKVLAKGDNWEVYTDGRVGAFASWVYGQGLPRNTYGVAPDGSLIQLWDVKGGGFTTLTEQGLQDSPIAGQTLPNRGTINVMRLRSGFIGNTLGLGVRGQVTPWTTVSGYFQIWAYVESEGRQKNRPNPADVRQGYAKLEGLWGSLIAGRTRALFSRGATDIDTMYAHRWGVGWPGGIDSNGPTQGQIGFGVLGSGFSAGLIYGTPVLKGLQLNIGVFDPIQIQNAGWNRTKYARPEAELTFERRFGNTGKVVLFANGAYQKVYKDGYCPPPTAANPLPCDETAGGVGYGGRFELGPVHLGVAGHYGKGLGLNYALEASDASGDLAGNLRWNDGYYAQSQVVLGKFDLFAGWGIARVNLTDFDKQKVHDPRLPSDPNWTPEQIAADAANGIISHSVIKYQMGINAGIVYNVTPNLHVDLDYFRAKAAWFLGETQVVHVVNSGMIFNW